MLEGKKVLPTKLLVQRNVREQKFTQAGLLIPDTTEESSVTGTVLLTGEGTTALPMIVKVGQKVLYPPRAVQKVAIEDQTYWLLGIQDVLLFW